MRGVGCDWPIGYADMAPYYDKAERFIGVTGRPEGLRSAPDGIFQTPAPFKPHEQLIYRACAKLGIKATSSRQAVITSPLNGRPGMRLLRPVRPRLRVRRRTTRRATCRSCRR